jgi:hypothetical protein
MSGAGADPVVRGFIALSYRGAGRPVRWLVTIAGEVFSSVASAKNSNATSTEPTTEKKARIGIGAFLASERNAVQDQQAHKNCRQRQTEHLCSPIVTRTEYLCSCALICICHDVDPRISLFCGQQGKARARPSGRTSARRSPSTIERSRKPIPRCNTEVRK